MQQLAKYLKERENFDSLIRDEGFAEYKINGEECYIRSIWVEKDFRKKGIASDMADDISRIAIGQGCKYLTGTVDVTANGAHESMLVLLAYGFRLHSAVNYGLFFRKSLEAK